MGYTWTGGHSNVHAGPGAVQVGTDVCELHRNFANGYSIRVAVGLNVVTPPDSRQTIDILRIGNRIPDQLPAVPGVSAPGDSDVIFRGQRPTSLTATLLPGMTLAIQVPFGAEVKWEVHIFETPVPADDSAQKQTDSDGTVAGGGSGGFNPWKLFLSLFGIGK